MADTTTPPLDPTLPQSPKEISEVQAVQRWSQVLKDYADRLGTILAPIYAIDMRLNLLRLAWNISADAERPMVETPDTEKANADDEPGQRISELLSLLHGPDNESVTVVATREESFIEWVKVLVQATGGNRYEDVRVVYETLDTGMRLARLE